TAAAGVEPASNTTGSIPRATRWAAAARPVGPAPMTATGRSVVAVLSGMIGLRSCGGGLVREEAGACPEGDVDECHEDRDFDEWADDTGQCLPRGDSVGADGDSDGEFEVVARRGERQRGRLLVAEIQSTASDHADGEDNHEIEQQRQCDARDIQGIRSDLSALKCEEEDDGEQQSVECPGTDARQEPVFVPFTALRPFSDGAGEKAGKQWKAEEDEHAGSDGPEGELTARGRQSEQVRQPLEIEPAEEAEGQDLEDRIDRDEHGGGFAVTAGEIVPDEDHRNAACQADDDQPGAVFGKVGEE